MLGRDGAMKRPPEGPQYMSASTVIVSVGKLQDDVSKRGRRWDGNKGPG